MTLRIDDKKAIVSELAEIVANSGSAIAAEYRGLTVGQMTKLRSTARKSGIVVRVYRNTLARKAVAGTRFECLQEALVGPTILMFSRDEPATAAKMVRDFAKNNEKFIIKALVLEGKLLGADQLKAVASLPTRNEAIAQLMSVMNAPVGKLARTLVETYAQLVRVVSAVADKKRT